MLSAISRLRQPCLPILRGRQSLPLEVEGAEQGGADEVGRESMAEKEKRQMVQKSDNEFVKSRIELHCIVPFANTIIPDSRKKKQPLRTRTFPNLRTMNGLRFIGGIGTSGCLRAERFPLPVTRAACIWPDTQNPPWRFSQGGFFHVIASSTHAITCGGS